ncbi:hypothetical protein [Gordonia sp. OPL2]|uniref:DUF7426 family protein n=1 Tax=Gordonia sp. OPL2 TaxID=2486274 RepID=UPI0016554C73|nr:hypothetical protein [Gordonia sp. OPL2]ROZ89013.1 hypothetical protein EEB19_20100 [Gordonia sp. OPL2]
MSDQFDEWLDSGLVLPIRGHEFRVEPPSAMTILCLHRRLISEKINDATEREDIRAVLGPTWQKMCDAGIPDSMAMHAGRTAVMKYLDDAEAAIGVWNFEAPTEPEREPEKRGPSIYGVDPDDSIDPPGTISDLDPGGGPYMPDVGMRVWAYPPQYAPAYREQEVAEQQAANTASWTDIFHAWDAIEIDFQILCQRDLTPELLEAKSWRWFAVRLSRILGDRSTLSSQYISSRKADQ